MSEVMRLLIHFHQSHYRHFKAYYTEYVQVHLRSEFPALVSYNRFVELMPTALVALSGYLRACYGQCMGISFIDATSLAVCDNHRIHSHRVFDGLAKRGKTSMGWFFEFKLHVVVNDCGQLLACCLSAAIVEAINDQLKNISQIEHTRHRSPLNFLVNLLAGLIAYCLQPKKPSPGISRQALVLA